MSDASPVPERILCPCGGGHATRRDHVIVERDRLYRREHRTYCYRHDGCPIGGHIVTVDGRETHRTGSLFPETFPTALSLRGKADHPDGDGRRGVTLGLCNAIRCAAADGLTYREMADLFTSFDAPRTAHLHATGACAHGDGGLPPVASERDRGPVNPVTAGECADMRRDRAAGATVRELAADAGRSTSTVSRHLNGQCGHGTIAGEVTAD